MPNISWPDVVQFYPMPGLAICILGGLAAMLTWRVDKKPGLREKVLWNILIFALMGAEIFAITHDRRDQDTKHLAELGRQEEHFEREMEFLVGLKTSFKGDLENVNANLAKAKIDSPKGSLKIITLQLSKDILEFSAEIDEYSPSFPAGRGVGEQNAYFLESTEYMKKVIASYHKKFDGRIIDLFSEFKRKHIDYQSSQLVCGSPPNSSSIGYCGVNLRLLGNTLK